MFSAMIFHIAMGISIIVAPIGMEAIYMEEEEEFVSIEMIPPQMETEPQIRATGSENTEV